MIEEGIQVRILDQDEEGNLWALYETKQMRGKDGPLRFLYPLAMVHSKVVPSCRLLTHCLCSAHTPSFPSLRSWSSGRIPTFLPSSSLF